MPSPKEDIYMIPFKVQGTVQKGEKFVGSGRQEEGPGKTILWTTYNSYNHGQTPDAVDCNGSTQEWVSPHGLAVS